ncbi:MAG: PAS domain S-box protein, partial [Candidatus Aminicenantes bacterium]|nr:PAS domain S-box protein [Candidatus Aminicenantes bacterium]
MTKKKTDHDDSADLRKRAEEALRQAEENFRRSLDESPLGMRIVSADGETLYANRAILDIYGYAGFEELKTTPIKKRYTPESYAEFQIRLEKRRRGEYLPSKYEVSIVRKNGEVRHLQVFRKETFWNGEAQYQVLYDDITERKRAEEALRESEERYRRLVETAPEVIYNLSAEDGTITLLNPAFERITGWSRAEWLGKPFMPLVHPDDLTLAMETFQQVSRGEATPPYELRILSKSGEYFIGEFTSFPHIEKRKVIGEFGIARDITERKKAEKEIQNLAKFPSENPNPVLRIARDGLLLYVNEAGVRQLADLHLQVGRATPPMLREVVFQVMENGSAQVLDLEHRERAYSFFVAPVVDAGYADLYGLDITERKRAEAELIEREGFNFALFEYNPIQTVVVDLEGKVIKFNLAKKKSGDRLPNIGDTMYKD